MVRMSLSSCWLLFSELSHVQLTLLYWFAAMWQIARVPCCYSGIMLKYFWLAIISILCSAQSTQAYWHPATMNCAIRQPYSLIMHQFALISAVWIPPVSINWCVCSLCIASHCTISVCMFSWRPECQIAIWGHQNSLWTSLNPKHWRGCTSFHPRKAMGVASLWTSRICLERGVHQTRSHHFFQFVPKLGAKPLTALSIQTRSPTSVLNIIANHASGTKSRQLKVGWLPCGIIINTNN